ncbi:3-hydroxyacyl-CoA dehydrogenase NAD-binding domain-containing protein [Pollutimonas harenae]|uniref:Enoyl-CoA hydratase/isomerase family protein n=1 Tax=Pollutimonas harenae TaxID=657015 RepID=A0A853GR64_9BURK|nr:3-hydroxyacyl-CoA dehydrogenase NAD-binding domain-containing protein [Pollutimonas harenae]NYT84651.1 enoyl-CoA hydratase/isomerase family protein [Pollutimonas harenae]TEA72945.1 enoyl-CoA hydratase [Pollutimonas harenae]
MTDHFDTLGLANFTCRVDDEGVAWLTLDCHDSSINRLSADVMRELSDVLDLFDKTRPAGVVIQSGKEAGFIAGADINEFAGLDTAAKGLELVSRGWTLFNRLAQVDYPTLALIHGHCLGGGLELALACRYRLVVDQADTSLSLPEVMLGIFPGWGGMQRLPQLIGAPAALDMMLAGKPQYAHKAVRLGLADGLVAPRLAVKAARTLVLSGKRRRRAQGVPALLNHSLARPLVARLTARKLDARDPYHHYPAPRAILQIWEKHGGNALKAPQLVDQLVRSDTASNLLRVFRLQESLKEFAKTERPQSSVHWVHVIGAGVMGGDIAAWCALKGLTVTLQDQDRERIAAAQGRAAKLFARKARNARDARAAADRMTPDLRGDGIRHADIVIEAITENLDAKRELYVQIKPLMQPDAVLATNTSSLSLEALGAGLNMAERFIGLHFFNPVARMPLVEVVETKSVSTITKQAAYTFVGAIGKLPLPVQDAPGFLVNAVLAPYMLEAMRCVDEGIRPETLDAAMLKFGMPMGPIELIDTVGLDIARDAGLQLTGQTNLPACLEHHLDRKELGRKSGQGFYRWQNDKAIKPDAGTIPPDLASRLITPLIDKTKQQLQQGVVANADLADAGVVFGTGFAPFTGGPLHYNHQQRR